MITIGEVAANVTEHFFVAGHPAAHIFLEHVSDCIEGENLNVNQPLRYQGDKRATCQYCYKTHDEWILSNEHFPPCWICENCNYATADKHMEMES